MGYKKIGYGCMPIILVVKQQYATCIYNGESNFSYSIKKSRNIKPFQALLRNTPFCSSGEVGARGRATAKPTGSRRSSADGFAVRMKRTKAGAGL